MESWEKCLNQAVSDPNQASQAGLVVSLPSSHQWVLHRDPLPLLYPACRSPEPLDAQVADDLDTLSSTTGHPSSKSGHLRPSPSLVSMSLWSPQSPLSVLHLIRAPNCPKPRRLERPQPLYATTPLCLFMSRGRRCPPCFMVRPLDFCVIFRSILVSFNFCP
jgi:hypothetical protein